MRIWFGLIMLMMVAACTVAPTPPNGGDTASPEIFNETSNEISKQAQPEMPKRITVLPIEGPSLPMSNLLTGSVVTELEKLGYQASFGIALGDFYSLKGIAKRNEWSVSLPYVVLINWVMTAPSGAVVGKYVQGIEDKTWQWDYGSPKIIQDTGVIAAAMVSEMLGDRPLPESTKNSVVSGNTIVTISKAPAAETLPAVPVEPVAPEQAPQSSSIVEEVAKEGVWILPITGASGDGNWQLAQEMKKAVVGVGLKLADSEEKAKYFIEAKVSLFMNYIGKEEIIIIWDVLNSEREDIGNATQHNQVEPGTFRGTWWKMASVVVNAVIKGVTDIITKHALATMVVDENIKDLDLKLELDDG